MVPSSITSSCKQTESLSDWDKLRSSGKALLSKAGRGRRAAFHPSCITGTETPENRLFIAGYEKREGDHMEKLLPNQPAVPGQASSARCWAEKHSLSSSHTQEIFLLPPHLPQGDLALLQFFCFPSDPQLPCAQCWVPSTRGDAHVRADQPETILLEGFPSLDKPVANPAALNNVGFGWDSSAGKVWCCDQGCRQQLGW